MGKILDLEHLDTDSVKKISTKVLKLTYQRNRRYLTRTVHPMIKSELLQQQDVIAYELQKRVTDPKVLTDLLSDQLSIDVCGSSDPIVYEKKVVNWLRSIYIPSLKHLKQLRQRSLDNRVFIDDIPSPVSKSYSSSKDKEYKDYWARDANVRYAEYDDGSVPEKVILKAEGRMENAFEEYIQLKQEVDEIERKLQCSLSLEQQEVIQIKYIQPFLRGQRERSDEEVISKLPYEKTYYYSRKIKASALARLASALGFI